MADEETESRGTTATTPTEETSPYQHPADHSWTLQAMMEIQKSIGSLEKATDHLQQDVREIRTDIKGMVGRGQFWVGITVVIGFLGALISIYFAAGLKGP